MKEFTPNEFSLKLAELVFKEAIAMEKGLKIVANKIKRDAKNKIGHYQKGIGKFPEWAELADSTLQEKERLGYSPPDNPLLRTGDMRASIKSEVKGLEAVIGSTDPKSVYHEFGTSKMPMRPFIGPAAFKNKKFIMETIGTAVVAGFYGKGQQIHESLGYDFEAGEE